MDRRVSSLAVSRAASPARVADRGVLAVERPLVWVAPLLSALSLLWLAAGVLSVRVVQLAVVPLLVCSWLLATGGCPAARPALAIADAFLSAVPLLDVA